MTLVQWATSTLALIGGLLGPYNTWAAYRRESSRLRIIEDYKPLKEAFPNPPRYEIRLENVGQIPIALESVMMVLKGEKAEHVITIWPTVTGSPLIAEPHRVVTLSLPPDALYGATHKQKSWVVVKTETAGIFKRRARKFWRFASDYGAMVEVACAPANTSVIP